MAIDILKEPPITFNEAARYLPEGKRPAYSTWWRWFRHGIRGIKLETVLIGGGIRCTSAEAVARFVAATTAAADDQPTQFRTPAQREREIRKAEEDLKRAGI